MALSHAGQGRPPGAALGNHPGSKLVWFEKSAHGIFEDEPEKSLGVIREFLSGLRKP